MKSICMIKMVTNKYIFYPGCLISYRFPFIEKSMRLVADRFGIELIEPEGFTCCPDPQGIQSYDEELWILTAARNLALAEKAGLDILTICNGCYSTFRKVSTILKEDSHLFDKVNAELSEFGLQFKGTTKVKHLHEFILQDISLKRLKNAIERPLDGLNVAIHYGCHITRPSSIVEFNDNRKPVTLEEIVATLGANSIEYEMKDACCGGSLNLLNEIDSFGIIQKKLMHIQKAGANCIAVVCPYCYLQFEMGQLKLAKQNVEIAIPVLHLAELIAVALGIENIDTLLQMHKIKPNFPPQQLESELMKYTADHLNLDFLKICTRCRACSKDCTLVGTLDFDPLRYVDLILEGRVLEAIQSEGIWKCLNCYGCYEKCPQRMGLAQFFMKLRNLAIKKGYEPASIASESGKFLQDGVVTGKLTGGRKRLDLPVNSRIGIEELRELLEKKAKQDVEI